MYGDFSISRQSLWSKYLLDGTMLMLYINILKPEAIYCYETTIYKKLNNPKKLNQSIYFSDFKEYLKVEIIKIFSK